MDLIKVIQIKVDEIFNKKYTFDQCPPEFTVSLFQEQDEVTGKIKNHKILLTVVHNEIAHSRVIFPVMSYKHGYESIEKEMEWLYNSTM